MAYMAPPPVIIPEPDMMPGDTSDVSFADISDLPPTYDDSSFLAVDDTLDTYSDGPIDNDELNLQDVGSPPSFDDTSFVPATPTDSFGNGPVDETDAFDFEGQESDPEADQAIGGAQQFEGDEMSPAADDVTSESGVNDIADDSILDDDEEDDVDFDYD